MVLKILIGDDDSAIVAYLTAIIEHIPEVVVVAAANNGAEVIRKFEKNRPNIVILDVDMPEKNGIEAARELAQKYQDIYFVFVTAHSNYVFDAYELYSFDYILKPIDEKRVQKTIKRLQEKVYADKVANCASKRNIAIQVEGRRVFINPNEIVFIESVKPKVLIRTMKQKYLVGSELHTFEESLNPRDFFRCHKGYIVNLKYIKEVIPSGRTYEILLHSGDKILLSREKEKELREKTVII